MEVLAKRAFMIAVILEEEMSGVKIVKTLAMRLLDLSEAFILCFYLKTVAIIKYHISDAW